MDDERGVLAERRTDRSCAWSFLSHSVVNWREGGLLQHCRFALAVIALILGQLAVPVGAAEPEYPVRPVRLLVGYSPGSGADVVARLLASKMQETFGASVVVENKAGAGGTIAAEDVARASADGYVLMLGALPQMAIAPATSAQLRYDPVKDFVPIVLVAGTDMVLLTNPKRVPSQSIQEFLKWARQQSSLFFGTAGPGTLAHFGAYIFAEASNIRVEPVHFKSTADQLTALVNGDVQALFMPVAAAAPLVKSGRIQALMIAGPERSGTFPETASAKEAGLPSVEFQSWYGVFAPAKTPAAVVQKVHDTVSAAMRTPDALQKIEDLGLRVMSSGPGGFDRYLSQELDRWSGVAKRTGFKAQQ